MRHILSTVMMAAGIMMLQSCKEKKHADDFIVTNYEVRQPQPPIAMSPERQTSQVSWMGKPYTVDINRVPVDSLAMVTDDWGQEYIDNSISVTVKRADGSVFFARNYTKNSFLSYVDENFRRNGVLASIRLSETSAKELVFMVVIGLPDAVDDVFIPLELSVDVQGGISIRRVDNLDLLDYDDSEEDDD